MEINKDDKLINGEKYTIEIWATNKKNAYIFDKNHKYLGIIQLGKMFI